MNIKDPGKAAAKWSARAQQAGQDYTSGVQNPRRPWQASTDASAPNWAAGVAAAAQNGSFQKGVDKAGDAKWARKAVQVGAGRYGPGVAAATPDYTAGVAAYFTALSSATLPSRYPKGDPRNNARSLAVQNLLRSTKTGKPAGS